MEDKGIHGTIVCDEEDLAEALEILEGKIE